MFVFGFNLFHIDVFDSTSWEVSFCTLTLEVGNFCIRPSLFTYDNTFRYLEIIGFSFKL